MKKQIYILFLMVFLCLLSGCSAQKNYDNSADTQISENTDFDKLVGIQADVDFFQNGIGQAGIADHDDRVETVSLRS